MLVFYNLKTHPLDNFLPQRHGAHREKIFRFFLCVLCASVAVSFSTAAETNQVSATKTAVAEVKTTVTNAVYQIADFKDALTGGDAEAGKAIFFQRPDASCTRCHKVGEEGGEIGPVLSGIGSRQPREYILESIVAPNAKTVPGFDSIIVATKKGVSYAGILKKETDTELEINSTEDGMIKVKKSDIESRAKGMSPMPEGMGQILSKDDLKNLVEFLASLKGK